ncbi:hypothetical protein CFRS1_v015111 [Colletotrichum fructicola]|nr:hypothetical protein CFRS1_v015111 [Colletotrichum fructicola]
MPQSSDNTTPPSTPKASSTNGTNGHTDSAPPATDPPVIDLDKLPAADIQTREQYMQMMKAQTSTNLTQAIRDVRLALTSRRDSWRDD